MNEAGDVKVESMDFVWIDHEGTVGLESFSEFFLYFCYSLYNHEFLNKQNVDSFSLQNNWTGRALSAGNFNGPRGSRTSVSSIQL